MASMRYALVVSLAIALFAAAAAPATCIVLDEKELYMSLYLHQTFGGNGANQIVVVRPGQPGSFGEIAIHNWAVTDGEGNDATVLGRAEGIHFKSNDKNYHTTLTIVFEGTRFKGSMLQMMGYIAQDGQWSILGGTGKLSMARGVVDHKVVRQTSHSRIYKINIHAFYYYPLGDWKQQASSNCDDMNRKILAFDA